MLAAIRAAAPVHNLAAVGMNPGRRCGWCEDALYVAEKIVSDIERGKLGFLFRARVEGWSHSTRKFIRYNFPDGSYVIREEPGTSRENVQGFWPKTGEKPDDDPVLSP